MATPILTDAPPTITPAPRRGRAPTPERRAREDRLIERAFRVLEQRAEYERPQMTYFTASRFFVARLGSSTRELFDVGFLDNQHRLLCAETLFAGGIDSCEVSTRIIVQRTLELNAAAVIVSHNHPSGDPSPSDPDKHLTERIKSALALVDVRLLDHIIVGGVKHSSFALLGLL